MGALGLNGSLGRSTDVTSVPNWMSKNNLKEMVDTIVVSTVDAIVKGITILLIDQLSQH